MRPVQNNFANLQINQIAAEQAALQAVKNQQTARVRAETAEEILKQQEKNDAYPKTALPTDPDSKKKSNSQNFKNVLYSKDGKPQTNTDYSPGESKTVSQITHIDFKV
jgi:hypothetical protein